MISFLSTISAIAITETFCLVVISAYLSRCLYNVYFHPLRSIPGPKLWAASRIPKTYYKLRGVLPFVIKDLHDKYGETVRITPDTIDYTSWQAWEEIYGFVKAGKERNFPKDMSERRPAKNPKVDIINATEQDHRRFRRLQSHAFSEKALASQESFIQDHAQKFISGVRDVSSSSPTRVVPLSKWYNLATFDLIGDLAFGESFHGTTTGIVDPWIVHIFDLLETLVWELECSFYPILTLWVYLTSPKDKVVAMASHRKLAREKAERRINTKTDRPDFMSYILKHNETEKGMTVDEIKSNASILMLGGSETTASLLTGLTYHLLQTPRALEKLTHEIRTNFEHDDMSLQRLAEMKYLNACLEEGLRIYPPVPGTLGRLVPTGGAVVCGKFLPEGTSVGVNQYAAGHLAANFYDPETFHPERWLGDPRFSQDNRRARQPFSYGPANCIGINLAYAELRVLLAKLVWNFDLEDGEGLVKIEKKSGKGGSGRGKGNWLQRNRIYFLWLKPELWVCLKERKDT